MDKSIKYYSVLMIRKSHEELKEYKLPEGFEIVAYKTGMEQDWAEVETSVEEFSKIEDAKDRFKKEFINSSRDLSKQCYFVKNQNGQTVATTSIWQGTHLDGVENYRLHWVAVNPEYKGKGIATALISYILGLNFLKGKDIYLTTQTWSYRAIKIYMKLGFKPYFGPIPKQWSCEEEEYEEYNKEAWNLILDKISN